MKRKILILAANPKDTSRLRLDKEVREIENGLERAKKRDEFLLKQRWAIRPQDVRRAMLRFKPNIVHFCGHGQGTKGVAFENEEGYTQLVDGEALAGFFALFSDSVECVILNACYSEIQAKAIAENIDYVIGMRKEIGDATAVEFAVAFYDALGAGESIEFAYRLACNAIRWAGVPEHLTPILKSRTGFSEQNGGVNMRDVFHPPGTEGVRGKLQDCTFFINPAYKRKRLWQTLADVLVEIQDSEGAFEGFLIPSGLVTPSLRHTDKLRQDRAYLAKKRRATVQFIEKWGDYELEGKWFVMRDSRGERIKVYSSVYDEFLNASLESDDTY